MNREVEAQRENNYGPDPELPRAFAVGPASGVELQAVAGAELGPVLARLRAPQPGQRALLP